MESVQSYIANFVDLFPAGLRLSVVALSVLCITWTLWKWLSNRKYRLPPGPVGLPVLGYWPFLGKNVAHKQLFNLRKKYGPLVSMYFGNRLVVVLLDYPTLKEAFGKPTFLGRPPVSAFTLVKEGVSFNDTSGQVWRVNRRFTMQVMRDLGFGKTAIHGHIQNEVAELLNCFQKADGKPIETRILLTSSVSNNITALIFGRRLDYSDPLRKFLDYVVLLIMDFFKQTSVHAYFPWVMKVFVFLGIWKYDKAKETLQKFYKFVDQEIVEHRKTLVDSHNRDYIDGYVKELDKRQDPETDGFSTRFLKGNIRSMFGAGSEATRTSLEWCLMTMAGFPEYQRRIQKELDTVTGRDRMPTFEDMTRTPLTQAAILEVLRWRGVVPLGIVRQVTKKETLLGYDIPEGTIAIGHIWGIHHDSNLWKDPMTYMPERFISKEGKVEKPEFFIPFSYGRRSCPGESLAHIELYLYFANILQRFQVLPPEGKKDLFEEELAITLQLLDTNLRLVERPRITE